MSVVRIFVQVIAALLAVPAILIIWWPAIYLYYSAEEQDFAMLAFLFRVFIIGFAVLTFVRLPAKAAPMAWLPGFAVFPVVAVFNPFDVVWWLFVRERCSSTGCVDRDWAEVIGSFLAIWSPLLLIQFVGFGLLFAFVRVAAGKMWPGRPERRADGDGGRHEGAARIHRATAAKALARASGRTRMGPVVRLQERTQPS
jgi:hypothetical protein